MACARQLSVRAIAMRDSDCDLTSLIVVRADSQIHGPADLRGKTVAVGAVDSPQASLIPLSYLGKQGLVPTTDFSVQRHNLHRGKHGDHIGGPKVLPFSSRPCPRRLKSLQRRLLTISLATLFLESSGDVVHVFGVIGQRAHLKLGEKKQRRVRQGLV